MDGIKSIVNQPIHGDRC